MKHCLLIWLCTLTFLATVQAQNLQVSSPISGAVYQQDAQNQGKIVIQGDFNSQSFFLGDIYITETTQTG